MPLRLIPLTWFATLICLNSVDAQTKLSEAEKSWLDEAKKAVADDPKNALLQAQLGQIYMQLRLVDEAITALGTAIELNQDEATTSLAQNVRGDAYLWNGQFKEAIADFDAFLKVYPQRAPEHWQRGIALYYAGRYEDGVKQFETHKTVNPEDVENAAWHYLCQSKVIGTEKARKELIEVTKDRRVPMAEIQKLYAGSLKPEDVLAAAEKITADTPQGTSARFYANLYVALWYEAEDKPKLVLEHLSKAVEKYEVRDYMWAVANAHYKLIKAKK